MNRLREVDMEHETEIRGVIFDIDGTLALMDKSKGTYTALPGAVDALEKCRKAGLPVVAYTNGTFFPPSHYYPLLADAGLVIDPGFVMTPASVAAHHLAQLGHKRVMVLGGEGSKVPMREAGFEVVEPISGQDPVDAVLTGWVRDFGVKDLEALCEAVWAGAVPFTASNAPFFASSKGKMLGVSGAVSAMIAHTTGQIPMVLGKPATLGMDMSSKLMGLDPAEIAVIGDDPALEIAMARKSGALAIGVTTGISDTVAFEAADLEVRAQLVVQSLRDLPISHWFSNVVA
jgi:4-nitrophenyl phosphatase|tara:strand:+ start:12385 stop:13248 length:864 start_codon:yes stop_codon:yes gene_type:complete